MPFHSKRRWRVEKVSTAEELAEKLTTMSWCMCQGFQCQDLIWLNDATGPDGAQEWAVVRAKKLHQMESITVGWAMKEDDVKQIIQQQKRFANGKGKPSWGPDYDVSPAAFDHPAGDCGHCA